MAYIGIQTLNTPRFEVGRVIAVGVKVLCGITRPYIGGEWLQLLVLGNYHSMTLIIAQGRGESIEIIPDRVDSSIVTMVWNPQ